MNTETLNNINDFNQNVGGNGDPRLEGYLPVDYFRIVDVDHTSRRIRDNTIPVEHFYDYNLESACIGHNNDEE